MEVTCWWACGWAGLDHLRCVFTKQMGLTDKDIVVLSGAHTLVGHGGNRECRDGGGVVEWCKVWGKGRWVNWVV